MSAAVHVEGLVKRYGAVEAVRGLSLEVATGEIVGLLGPNGAGKSTSLECIIGLRQADAGTITVCGVDVRSQPREMRERVGVQLQATALPEKITVREALRLFASFYRRAVPPDELIARFSLGEKANAAFDTLSGGQRQRLAMALAVINEPEVLFLDEPTAALDPQARRELHEVIRGMKKAGRTVLITTHHIEEAELLCDRVAIIDHGRVIACDTPAALVARANAPTRVVCTTVRPLAPERLATLPGVTGVDAAGTTARLATTRVNLTVIDLMHLIEAEGNELSDLQIRKPSLEDVFLELTGRALRD